MKSIKELSMEVLEEFQKKQPGILVTDMYAALWMAIEAYIIAISDDKDLEKAQESLAIMTSDILNRLSAQGWK